MTFGRPSLDDQRARRNAEREANMRALAIPSKALSRGSYGGECSGVVVAKGIKAKPGKRAPTAEERRWMDFIVAFGCIACRMDGLGIVPPCVHHILRGGQRMGHLHTIGLCDPGHHQNGAGRGMVSRHPWKTRFEQRYGSEDSLLARLRAEYGAMA